MEDRVPSWNASYIYIKQQWGTYGTWDMCHVRWHFFIHVLNSKNWECHYYALTLTLRKTKINKMLWFAHDFYLDDLWFESLALVWWCQLVRGNTSYEVLNRLGNHFQIRCMLVLQKSLVPCERMFLWNSQINLSPFFCLLCPQGKPSASPLRHHPPWGPLYNSVEIQG